MGLLVVLVILSLLLDYPCLSFLNPSSLTLFPYNFNYFYFLTFAQIA